mmetsp:Transcript_59065/g.191256  ORF Transcript_59065/g.191256 Transcript_59065/m.191256 type:complete len:146 (+) Transcript_59065:20-457(+)
MQPHGVKKEPADNHSDNNWRTTNRRVSVTENGSKLKKRTYTYVYVRKCLERPLYTRSRERRNENGCRELCRMSSEKNAADCQPSPPAAQLNLRSAEEVVRQGVGVDLSRVGEAIAVAAQEEVAELVGQIGPWLMKAANPLPRLAL